MKKLIAAATLAALLATPLAFAETATPAAGDSCEAKAVSKDGKPLAGAAKTAYMKKCEKDHPADSKPAAGKTEEAKPAAGEGCEVKAIGKNGKPLAGAAKTAFMKKCEKDSKVEAPAAKK